MQQFLSWLWASAQKVYAWFSSRFYDYLDTVENTWDWIIEQANRAYSDAVRKAREWVNDLLSDIQGLFDWVEYQFGRLRNDVLEDLTGLFNWVEYQISQVQSIQLPSLDDIINMLYDYVMGWLDPVWSWVGDRIQEVQGWVMDSFGWLFDSFDYLSQLITSIPFDLFPAIADFIYNGYGQLRDFLDNPVVWILDMIQDRFLGFLSYVLAHAIGTTHSELPTNKPWR